jgi:hypothetical protein
VLAPLLHAGRLQCLGSVQHLKNRFGEGYTLDVRLECTPDADEHAGPQGNPGAVNAGGEHNRVITALLAALEPVCPGGARVVEQETGRVLLVLPAQQLDLAGVSRQLSTCGRPGQGCKNTASPRRAWNKSSYCWHGGQHVLAWHEQWSIKYFAKGNTVVFTRLVVVVVGSTLLFEPSECLTC